MIVKKVFYFGSAVASAVGTAFLIKDYMGGEKITECEDVKDKIIIITGANTGIGKEVARDLAKREAKVIMACRDLFKCETTRKEIVLETKNKYVYCRKCDLASQSSIREFVKTFKKEHKKLDILINNAGVMRCPKSLTEDGIEMQLGVNHMGHFLLTNLLIDIIKLSAPSKIINVSSVAHTRGKINIDDLNSVKNYDPGDAYSQSKLANILFTKELSKRLKNYNVTVNAVHPGLVDTEITRHMPFFDSIVGSIIIRPLFWIFIKTPKQGAQTILHAALDPSLNNVTGVYLSNFKITEESEAARDESIAAWLWKTSEKWTKL